MRRVWMLFLLLLPALTALGGCAVYPVGYSRPYYGAPVYARPYYGGYGYRYGGYGYGYRRW